VQQILFEHVEVPDEDEALENRLPEEMSEEVVALMARLLISIVRRRGDGDDDR